MSTTVADEPAGIPPSGQEPDFYISNPIYPFIIVSVVLCTILTIVFTAARLATKYLVSRLDFEDCEWWRESSSIRYIAKMNFRLDLLILAWVSIWQFSTLHINVK